MLFGEIRTCQVNNQIMFVGKDMAVVECGTANQDYLNMLRVFHWLPTSENQLRIEAALPQLRIEN